MTTKPLRWLLPFITLGAAYAGYSAIASSAPESLESKPPKAPPVVTVSKVQSSDHKVVITSHGELRPVEVTQLSAQVSGEVISWHANFVVGGIVKRGEVLFSIENDNYQAAVLQAEAQLASAQAALIEEKAKAEVAKRQAKSMPEKQVTDLYLRKPQLLSANAQVKSAQAELKRAKRDLENCQIIAPYDALVVSRDIGVGQFITAGAHVATLNNVEAGEVHIYRLPQELVNNRQVWVVNDNNQLEPRTVNVLRAEKEFMLINQGLNDDDMLVLTVPEYPQQGLQVEVAAKTNQSSM